MDGPLIPQRSIGEDLLTIRPAVAEPSRKKKNKRSKQFDKKRLTGGQFPGYGSPQGVVVCSIEFLG